MKPIKAAYSVQIQRKVDKLPASVLRNACDEMHPANSAVSDMNGPAGFGAGMAFGLTLARTAQRKANIFTRTAPVGIYSVKKDGDTYFFIGTLPEILTRLDNTGTESQRLAA